MVRLRLGGKLPYYPVVINDHKYKVLNANDFIPAYLTYPKYPDKWWELKTTVFVGAPGIGKSTAIRYFISEMTKIYKDQLDAYETDDLLYAITEHKVDKFIQAAIVDDAVREGLDSYGGMGEKATELSRAYFRVRHILEEKCEDYNLNPAGVLFLFFAVQEYMRMHKSIRVNADLTIFKNYYPYLEKPPFSLEDEEILFLKDITREGKVFAKYKSRAFGLGITASYDIVKLEFPKRNFKIQKLNPPKGYLTPQQKEIQKTEGKLINILEKKDLENISKSFLYGFIDLYLEEHNITLNATRIRKIIHRAYYLRKQNKQKLQENKFIAILLDRFDLTNTNSSVINGFLSMYCEKNNIMMPNDLKTLIDRAKYLQDQDGKATYKNKENSKNYNFLIQKLRENFTLYGEGRTPQNVIRGFLIKFCEKNDISIRSTDLSDIIYLASYQQFSGERNGDVEEFDDAFILQYKDWFRNRILGHRLVDIAAQEDVTHQAISARISVQEKKLARINPLINEIQ